LPELGLTQLLQRCM